MNVSRSMGELAVRILRIKNYYYCGYALLSFLLRGGGRLIILNELTR